MKLYMVVDLWHEELPLFVSDSIEEVAAFSGVRKKSVQIALSKARKGCPIRSRYVEVEVEDDDEAIHGVHEG